MNILHINSTEELDEAVWQTESGFTEKEYNDWLKNACVNLQNAKDAIETLSQSDDSSVSELIDDIDVYMIGDIINLLDVITISLNQDKQK